MYDDDSFSPLAVIGAILGAIFALWLLIFVIAFATARTTPQAGEIGVVRSGPSAVFVGSWFNGHAIKKVIAPGSGNTGIGLGSSVHYYPADTVQRNYTITSQQRGGDRPGVDVVEVPTSDGIRVGLEGTFYFTTDFNGSPGGEQSVKNFDNRFGVRTFREAGTTRDLHPWEGSDGWSAFLDVVVRPIIDNDLRQSLATVTCANLVSSCALVHQQSVTSLKNGGAANNANIQKVQDEINATLKTDIKSTLGEDYFSNIQFRLARVTLPVAIQNQIDQAQAQFAAVGTAAAKVQQARLEATANREREAGYKGCPACAQIDELKAIPPSVTTFAPGAGFAVTK